MRRFTLSTYKYNTHATSIQAKGKRQKAKGKRQKAKGQKTKQSSNSLRPH